MLYRVLADAVMFVHLAFILFVAAGALLTWRWPRVAWAHLPVLAWGVGTVTIGFPCPLTTLEKALERRADGSSYDGGFVDQYLEDAVYPGEYSSHLRGLAAAMIVVGYLGLRRRCLTERAPTARDGACAGGAAGVLARSTRGPSGRPMAEASRALLT